MTIPSHHHSVYVDMLAAGVIAVLCEGGCVSQRQLQSERFDLIYDQLHSEPVNFVTQMSDKDCLAGSPDAPGLCL